jgi:hypothetical protein
VGGRPIVDNGEVVSLGPGSVIEEYNRHAARLAALAS